MSRVFKKYEIVRIAKFMNLITEKTYSTKNQDKLEFYKIRDRALFSLLYLTGARIGEVVKRLKKSDFEFIKFNKRWFMIVELYTEKNRLHPLRRTPINIEKEKELVDYVNKYVEGLEDEDYLFPFTKQRAWQIIARIISRYKKRYRNKFMNANHFLRHCRLTHLVTKYDFTDQDLVQFTGWSNSIPAKSYMHLRFKDLARKMI